MKSLYLIIALLLVGCGSQSRVYDTTTDNNQSEVVSSTPSPTIEDSSKKPPSIPDI